MKIFVIANQKGGVGKSTIACHLSWFLADRGDRVAHIDLDQQKNSTKTLRAFSTGTKSSQLFALPAPVVVANESGITLVEADEGLLEIERQPNQVIGNFKRAVLQMQNFDAVVMDTAPTAGVKQSAALITATDVFSPIELEQYSVDGLVDLIKTILGIKSRFNPDLNFIGLLPNRFNAVNPSQRAALDALLSRYPQYMVPAKIPTRSAISEAIGAGVPVWALPKSNAREAGKELRAVLELIVARSDR